MPAPLIQNRYPAANAVMHPNDPLCFDVVTSVGLTSCEVWIGKLKQGVLINQIGVSDYIDPATKQYAHNGTSFLAPYLGSIRIAWGTGGLSLRFQIRRSGGWRLWTPVVQVKVIDVDGLEGGGGLG